MVSCSGNRASCKCSTLLVVHRYEFCLTQKVNTIHQMGDHSANKLKTKENIIFGKNFRNRIRRFHSKSNPKKLFQLLANEIEMLLPQSWIHTKPECLVHGSISVAQTTHYAVLDILEVRLTGQVASEQ